MWPLVVVVATAVVAGVAAWRLARRWPDPTAPRLGAEVVAHGLDAHRRVRRFARRRLDPAAATGFALTAASAIVLIGTASVGVLLAMFRRQVGLADWDLALARFGARHATTSSTSGLRALTWFGGTAAVTLLSTLTLLFVLGARRTAPRARDVVLFLVLVVGGQFALSNLIKLLVARARPDIDPLTGFAGTSFPSGHATAAAATYLALALLLGRGRTVPVKAALGGVAVALAVAVAGTRVFLGVHWLTDVLAGVALGWAWFALVSIAFGGRLLRFGAPVQQASVSATTRG